MELNIRAGMRVLYKKNNSNWLVGEIHNGHAIVNEHGVFLPILTEEAIKQTHSPNYTWDEPDIVMVNINDLYTDAHLLDDWMKDDLLTKEEYVEVLKGEDFHRSIETAWVSDGEYYYYPVSKFNDTWVMKQPFNYILRME